jgi:hypothetical protein
MNKLILTSNWLLVLGLIFTANEVILFGGNATPFQPVAGRIVKAVPVTVGKNTTKWDVCVTRIDDKLNLGLDFFDACKAMIDLPHRTVTINGGTSVLPIFASTTRLLPLTLLTKMFFGLLLSWVCPEPNGRTPSCLNPSYPERTVSPSKTQT